jgi:hypothetical protein
MPKVSGRVRSKGLGASASQQQMIDEEIIVPRYPTLAKMLSTLSPPLTNAIVAVELGPSLERTWLQDYRGRNQLQGYSHAFPSEDIVGTRDFGFHYLFDIAASRLIAAWGISNGKDRTPRSEVAARMSGHPLTNRVNGELYHRGHTIPHIMGGRTDINLVPQLGSINSGTFKKLEGRAVATPGSLYFTYWTYSNPLTQRPSGVQQGCLIAGSPPMIEIKNFRN